MYTWEFNTAEDELAAMLLPIQAQSALASFMDALVFNPYEFARIPDEPVGRQVRFLAFGDGLGSVAVHIYDPDRLVLIVQVQWFG